MIADTKLDAAVLELMELRDKLDDAARQARSSGARLVIAQVQERLVNLAKSLPDIQGMVQE